MPSSGFKSTSNKFLTNLVQISQQINQIGSHKFQYTTTIFVVDEEEGCEMVVVAWWRGAGWRVE